MPAVQFLDEFLSAPDVKVIGAGLPELRQGIVRLVERQAQLRKVDVSSLLAPQAARDALFQDLHYLGGSRTRRLADQQVNVLGHGHGTHELIAVAHLTENPDENISGARGGEQRQTMVATAGDEVQMLEPIAAAQPCWHEKVQRTRPSKTGKDG